MIIGLVSQLPGVQNTSECIGFIVYCPDILCTRFSLENSGPYATRSIRLGRLLAPSHLWPPEADLGLFRLCKFHVGGRSLSPFMLCGPILLIMHTLKLEAWCPGLGCLLCFCFGNTIIVFLPYQAESRHGLYIPLCLRNGIIPTFDPLRWMLRPHRPHPWLVRFHVQTRIVSSSSESPPTSSIAQLIVALSAEMVGSSEERY